MWQRNPFLRHSKYAAWLCLFEIDPILQEKTFDPVKGRFIKFIGEKEINDKNFITIAELGILTE